MQEQLSTPDWLTIALPIIDGIFKLVVAGVVLFLAPRFFQGLKAWYEVQTVRLSAERDIERRGREVAERAAEITATTVNTLTNAIESREKLREIEDQEVTAVMERAVEVLKAQHHNLTTHQQLGNAGAGFLMFAAVMLQLRTSYLARTIYIVLKDSWDLFSAFPEEERAERIDKAARTGAENLREPFDLLAESMMEFFDYMAEHAMLDRDSLHLVVRCGLKRPWFYRIVESLEGIGADIPEIAKQVMETEPPPHLSVILEEHKDSTTGHQ